MNKLSEYCINITDGEHGTVIDDLSGEYFLLSNKNIVDGKIEITSDDRIISKESYEKINKRCKLENGDVVISTVGTLGKTAVLNGNINYSFQRSVGIIKTDKNKLNPYFLKYQLDTPSYQKRLVNLSKGAIQKCLFIDDISNLEIDVPSIDLQNHIVTILMNCDSKIANNNRINFELESLAKTIYDYWFLQFEFPNEEGKPYKSSGGKMVWNDELKREIPEGWGVKGISEIASLYQPKTISGDEILQNGKYLVYGANGIVGTYNEYNHENNEIAICCRGASCGDYLMTLPKSWITGNAMVVNISDAKLKEFVFYGLSKEGIAPFISGSAQPQITRTNLENMKLIMPAYELIDKFGKMSVSYRKQIENNAFQCQELTSLRDFLLPMLMNGQVTI